MIIRPDNISLDIDIIQNLKSELISINSRDKYLNNLVQQRLQKCSQLYLDNIDKKIDNLLDNIDKSDLNDIKKVITTISRKYSDLYRSEMSLYNTLSNLGGK